MAEKKSSFPMLPGAHWWALRDKFRQSIPGVVTDSYLAAALDMKATSARTNILPYLQDVGLIDRDGKTQDLARAWRDDEQYAKVCQQIRERLYPNELLEAAPNPEDRAAAERWFANHTGAGHSAVSRMAQFYAILVEADISKQRTESQVRKTPAKKREVKPRRQLDTTIAPLPSTKAHVQETSNRTWTHENPLAPGISINLQIHISADATPDQIDKIFESMARHIYRK